MSLKWLQSARYRIGTQCGRITIQRWRNRAAPLVVTELVISRGWRSLGENRMKLALWPVDTPRWSGPQGNVWQLMALSWVASVFTSDLSWWPVSLFMSFNSLAKGQGSSVWPELGCVRAAPGWSPCTRSASPAALTSAFCEAHVVTSWHLHKPEAGWPTLIAVINTCGSFWELGYAIHQSEWHPKSPRGEEGSTSKCRGSQPGVHTRHAGCPGLQPVRVGEWQGSVCLRACLHVCMYLCGVHMCVYVCTCIYTCTFVHVYTCVHIRVYVCVGACMCVHVCVCTCKHIRSRAPNSNSIRVQQGCENGMG